ncbi:IQ motif, EF-hand binding site [Phytophthora cactorum]|nr:IQ motif, EF-hand binding site [Phytophthora cactorum]
MRDEKPESMDVLQRLRELGFQHGRYQRYSDAYISTRGDLSFTFSWCRTYSKFRVRHEPKTRRTKRIRREIPWESTFMRKSKAEKREIILRPWEYPMAAQNLSVILIQTRVRGMLCRAAKGRQQVTKKVKAARVRSPMQQFVATGRSFSDERGFYTFVATKIQAWFRMQRLRWRGTLERYPLYHIAALQLQYAWKAHCQHKLYQQPAHGPNSAMTPVNRAALCIQTAWKSYTHRRIFRYYRDLLTFRSTGDPARMLRAINPSEASLLDASMGAQVRFRLGGLAFPPTIYYKIFTRKPVCDLGAFSPKDYTVARQSAPVSHSHVKRRPGAAHDSGSSENDHEETDKQPRVLFDVDFEGENWEAEAEEMFQWASALDYDEYVDNWVELGRTAATDGEPECSACSVDCARLLAICGVCSTRGRVFSSSSSSSTTSIPRAQTRALALVVAGRSRPIQTWLVQPQPGPDIFEDVRAGVTKAFPSGKATMQHFDQYLGFKLAQSCPTGVSKAYHLERVLLSLETNADRKSDVDAQMVAFSMAVKGAVDERLRVLFNLATDTPAGEALGSNEEKKEEVDTRENIPSEKRVLAVEDAKYPFQEYIAATPSDMLKSAVQAQIKDKKITEEEARDRQTYTFEAFSQIMRGKTTPLSSPLPLCACSAPSSAHECFADVTQQRTPLPGGNDEGVRVHSTG